MTAEQKISGRLIGILGMARSGVAAALLAKELGGDPFVSDSAPRQSLASRIDRLAEAGIEFETDRHSDRLLHCDYIVISPGIPLTAEIVTRIKEKHIPIFSELEFASWVCQGSIVAVTGSNGKTTTTTLIGEIFKAAGKPTFVCGNIGHPFSEVAAQVPADGIAVVEVSTFQLETIEQFKPKVAVILNLTPDHLDRHGSFQAYKEMKFRITENQDADDFFVINYDDPETRAASIDTRAARMGFSLGPRDGAVTFFEEDSLWAGIDGQDRRVISATDMGIPGRHNLENAAAAVASVIPFGIDVGVITQVLKSFPGVEHRLEKVGRVAGIDFINDSKATNVESTVVALKAVTRPVHLILGGRDKGAPYEPILQAGETHVKAIIAIGEARDKIFDALGRVFPIQFAESMEEAVRVCFEAARPGDTVLLSPACSSFDMFDNFEHRGRVFKEAVAALKNNRKENGTLKSH